MTDSWILYWWISMWTFGNCTFSRWPEIGTASSMCVNSFYHVNGTKPVFLSIYLTFHVYSLFPLFIFFCCFDRKLIKDLKINQNFNQEQEESASSIKVTRPSLTQKRSFEPSFTKKASALLIKHFMHFLIHTKGPKISSKHVKETPFLSGCVDCALWTVLIFYNLPDSSFA